jgi:Fe-S cluster assembly protein SufD
MSTVISEKNITQEVVAAIRNNPNHSQNFRELRSEALEILERLGLPGNKSEEYKHTPLTRILEKNFKFNVGNASASGLPDPKTFLIPKLAGHVVVFVNGKWSPELSSIQQEDGVVIVPFSQANAAELEQINTHLGKVADHRVDAFAAWNTAAWSDGLFVHVAKNKRPDKPILIHHLHDTTQGQVISAVRNLVVAETSSEITLLEKYDTVGSSNGFSMIVSEGVVADNAAVNWYSVQNDANRFHHELRQINQERASRVNTYTFTLDGNAVRNNLQLALEGEGIDSHMYGLYLISKKTLADNHTVVDHRQPNSFSNEFYKGIMDEKAKGVFNGKIYVRPNAQKTNAFQSNRNILLGDQATVNTKPQLEIWADDVKCSHGCTSGQLDEEALFYLRTRGINKDTARAMMLYAFAVELLETMKSPDIKEYIDSLISERLHKNF